MDARYRKISCGVIPGGVYARHNESAPETVFLPFLIIVLIVLFSIGAGLLEAWIMHRYFPDPENYPWHNVYPAFTIPEEGYAVFVDLDILQLKLYKDGELFKTWPCSGGSKESPSPLGLFRVNGIGNWGEGFGGSWISINVPWGKYGIHGTYEPWKIGRWNVSHGCIRMRNDDVRELKKYVRWGTPVYIKYDNQPFRTMRHGDIGSDVLELQETLLMLGYYQGMPDGRFGTGTELAVKKFQRDRKIKADGIVGWHTYNLLQTAID